MRLMLIPFLIAAVAMPALAADPKPEIERPTGKAQADGAAHSLRTIPEACARLEGRFTGNAESEYDFKVVRTSAGCQARARFVDPDAAPGTADGWILNDVITVPRAECPSRQAVVKVWRKPGQATTPELDAQGRARIYLDDSTEAAKAKRLPKVDVYAAEVALTGQACG